MWDIAGKAPGVPAAVKMNASGRMTRLATTVRDIDAVVGRAAAGRLVRRVVSVGGGPGRSRRAVQPSSRALHSRCSVTSRHIGWCGAALEHTTVPQAPTRADSATARRQNAAPTGPSSKVPCSGV